MIQELARQGLARGTLAAVCAEAKRNKATSVKYVVKVLESWAAQAKAMRIDGAKPPDKRNGFHQGAMESARKAAKMIFGEDYDVSRIS